MTENMQTSIITKHLKSPEKCQRHQNMYQSVIQRNFQIINGLLKKLDLIFTKHQDFEIEMINYSKRFSKLEADIETIHNQHRRDNLHISSNIEQLKHQLFGIDKQMKIIYDDCKKKGILVSLKSCNVFDKDILSSQKLMSCSDEKINNIQDQSKLNISGFDNSQMNSSNSSEKQQKKIIEQIKNDRNSHVQKSVLLSQVTNKNSLPNKNQEMEIKSSKANEQKGKLKLGKQKKIQIRKSLDMKFESKSNFYKNPHLQNNEPNFKQSTLFQKQRGSVIKKGALLDVSNNDSKKLRKSSRKRSSTIQQQQNKQVNFDKQQQQQNKKQSPMNFILKYSQKFINNLLQNQNKNQNQALLQSLKRIVNCQQNLKETINTCQQILMKSKQIQFRVTHIQNISKQFATNETLSNQNLSLRKQITKLSQFCLQNYANKLQTKKAFMYLQSKIKTFFKLSKNQNNPFDEATSSLVSKCLSCNRSANISDNKITQLKQVMFKRKSKHQVQQNSSLFNKNLIDLKSRTYNVLQSDKKRNFSKQCR